MVRRIVERGFQLDCGDVEALSDGEVVAILRAADPIIATGGRTLLSKILKGSRDQKVLSHDLDGNPCYGAFSDKTLALITNMIDRCILDGYLTIRYEGRLPVLIYADKGWDIEKRTYADELLSAFLSDASQGKDGYIERMQGANPECVRIALGKLNGAGGPGVRQALEAWLPHTNGKVKKRINALLNGAGRHEVARKSESEREHIVEPIAMCEPVEATANDGKPRRKVSLSLTEVVDAMEMTSDDNQTYYNTLTGELHTSFDRFVYGDVGQPEPDLEAEGWISLPDSYDIEDLRWMRDFAREQPDPMGSLLLDAAFERHPYRRFKDRAANLGFLNDWFAYREERMREITLDWFEDNGLITADADAQ